MLAAGWALLYAVYRGYYALGGMWGVPGVVRESGLGTFRFINAVATGALLVGVVAPLVLLRLRNTRARPWAVVACWLVAVGCVTHALVDIVQRILSLAGALSVTYPASMWAEVDRRAADLQDLFGNEPWFLIEGVLIWILGFLCVRPGTRARYTILSIVAVAVLAVVGVLASFGTIGRVVVG